jgi:ATP-binding protein involved in chromosome partitioning
VQALREGSDSGRPIVALEPDSEASQAIAAIAERLDVELAPTRRYNPGLKLLS